MAAETQSSPPVAIAEGGRSPADTELDSRLGDEALAQAIHRRNPGLVKELYDIAIRQLTFETGRQSRLDSKGTSLLTASGLSLTLIFTFGAQWLGPRLQFLNDGHPFFFWTILVAYLAGVLLGLTAAVRAVHALMVRTDEKQHVFWRIVSFLFSLRSGKTYINIREDVIFGDALVEADRNSDNAAAVARYQQTIVQHYWDVVRQQAEVHQEKALIVAGGQRLFIGFLAVMVPLAGLLASSPPPPNGGPAPAAHEVPTPR